MSFINVIREVYGDWFMNLKHIIVKTDTQMTQHIKLRTRVYSDCEVRNPEAYFNKVFHGYDQWKLLNSTDPNCILVETIDEYEFHPDEMDQLDDLYDAITPEMYESTSRTYVKV